MMSMPLLCLQGCMNNFTFGDDNITYYETIAGGAGAGPGWQGRSGVHTHMTNTRITDPEILERRYPVVLHDFSLRKGSGGAGKFRGGDGVVREVSTALPGKVMLGKARVHAGMCCARLPCTHFRLDMLHCAVLCYAVPCCAVLCRAVLCYAVPCRAVPCCAVICCTMLCCDMLHHAVLRCAVLHRAVLRSALFCYAMLHCAKLCSVDTAQGPSTFELHAADGVLEAIDVLHTVRAAHLPTVRPAGGSLRPAWPQPAAAFRWQEGQHGGQDLGPGQGWGPHSNPHPWYVTRLHTIATLKGSVGAASLEGQALVKKGRA